MNIEEVLSKYEPKRENILLILHEIQNSKSNQFLSREDIESVAKYLNLPPSKVYETATFYGLFSTKPRGKYIIRVCVSTPCHVEGAEKILETLEETLGIKVGETTEDGLFTLEEVSCLGICGVAPAMMINEEAFGNLTSERAIEIINSFKEKEEER
ncbi:MAG: NADH-quinone oxidoreductase subunit NuoE [bacterium]|nr:NADH-quinone oxidoreductase subunit NuoE [bacterium]